MRLQIMNPSTLPPLPGGPGGPWSPLGPCKAGPGGPGGPLLPIGPGEPGKPASPLVPGKPGVPLGPGRPGSPFAPLKVERGKVEIVSVQRQLSQQTKLIHTVHWGLLTWQSWKSSWTGTTVTRKSWSRNGSNGNKPDYAP